ncbi:flagellar biosynthesis anti-sigma factor FlgM [Parachitinimonas caeni]|uniref:Negative regulator of flagellin synthesis n=1 Tax=Parachitinimonas caeni TaxID=3031301 RepID=A0ABT7E0B6_9NEIS|nr:flagellar biosynthesis anti-sigma factor FlgM [Parachitinimonas caeni]MDK2125514.1 flagellar biosynthesis anti-sigma factor FlgM [Parachitinimonas caeni]
MKIDNTGKPISAPLTKGAESRASAAPRASKDEPAQPSRSDSVEINPLTSRLQSLEARLASQPVVDESRVAEIKQAIADGRFKIRADVIADKLVASVKELLANKG